MGGIGKTTLAQSLYERIIGKYMCGCFVEEVSKIYRDFGKTGILKQVLSQCLNEKNLEISNVSEGTHLAWTRLQNVKALIVLDSIDNLEQLQMFTGNRNILHSCLGGGSKIIIISRNKHILETYGVNYVYQVEPLNHIDAEELFCIYAFKTNHIMSDYEKLTRDVLSHVQGHPLAIQVLGASLCDRNISQWESELARLKESKSDNIINVLQISFDELNDLDKEIFLDIACFFNWTEKEQTMKVLKFRGFKPEIGLQNLFDKSLITIKDGNKICMHDLLIDLGKRIVRKESPEEPRKWSRLWTFQDFYKVMSDKMGSKNIEGISIKENPDNMSIKVDALSKMSKLKFLELKDHKFYGSLDHLCNELGYLIWDYYHLKSLPPSFQPNNLVELCLRESNIKWLWKGRKSLPNLRLLDLSNSENLMKVPNIEESLDLCHLNLSGCSKLTKLHPSIGRLRKLTFLNLEYCISLIKLPPLRDNSNLETLNLGGCRQLKEINPFIGLLLKLTFLNLYGCKNLVSLPNNILGLNSLEYLNLGHCSKLFGTRLLHEPMIEEEVKKLCISEGAICSRSTSSIMKKWFTWPLHLFHSRARNDSVSCLFPSLHALPCVRELDLRFCNLVHIPDAIRSLNFLEKLNLEGNNFCQLPSLKELSMLYMLNLKDCRELKCLPELPSQTHFSSERLRCLTYWKTGLDSHGCTELVEMAGGGSMALSCTIQLIQALYLYEPPGSYYGYYDFTPHISIIIPGSEIPSWFNNQHEGMGSFITVDQSPLIQQANNPHEGIGLLCCLVFSLPSPTKRSNSLLGLTIPIRKYQVAEDHLWLTYYRPLQSLRASGDDHSELKIHVKTSGGCVVEVKKYGYLWVYDKDLQSIKF